jgi:hypothetical protein
VGGIISSKGIALQGIRRILYEWSANGKCVLSSALFRRVEVPLALK